jgi:hypothetical protein
LAESLPKKDNDTTRERKPEISVGFPGNDRYPLLSGSLTNRGGTAEVNLSSCNKDGRFLLI